MTNPGLQRGVGGVQYGAASQPYAQPNTLYRPPGSPAFGAQLSRTSAGWSEQFPAFPFYNVRAGSCPRWKAAVARAWTGGVIAHLLCMGDSLTANTGNTQVDCYPGQLAAVLDADGRYGRVRTGVRPVSATTCLETTGPGFNTVSLFSFTSWSWTPGYNVSKITIYYITGAPSGASTFTWALDGGGTTTIDTSIGSANGVGSFTVTAGSVGSHTLALVKTGGNPVYILGAEAWDDSIAWRMKVTASGSPGVSSRSFAAGSSPSYNLGMEYSAAVAPDLSLIKWGANDQNVNGIAENLISEAVFARAQGCDPVFVSSNTFGGPNGPWPKKRDAIYAAAERADAPLVDLDRRWWDLTTAQRATFNADDHPTAVARHDEARMHYNLLTQLA